MKVIDMYGEEPKFRVNKHAVVKSNLGAYFSILTFTIILASANFIGMDIFKKEEPISYTQEDVSLKINPVKISNDKEMPIAVEIQNSTNFRFYDETVLQYSLSYVEYQFNPLGTDIIGENQTQLTIGGCNYDDWKSKTSRFNFDFLGLSSKLCLQFTDLNIYGSYTEDKFTFLNFQVKRCINNTSKVKCKSNDYINNLITKQQLNLNLFYPYTTINLTNNNAPIRTMIVNDDKYIVKDRHKEIFIEMVMGNLKTDNGFLFSEWRQDSFFNVGVKHVDLKDRDPEDSVLLTYIIASSNVQNTYFRKYIKITDVMASLGGIIKSTTLIFYFLNFKFSHIELMLVILNEIFLLKDGKKENIELNIQNFKNIKFHNEGLSSISKKSRVFKKNSTTMLSHVDILSKNNKFNEFSQMNMSDHYEFNKNYEKIYSKFSERKNSIKINLSFRDIFRHMCYNRNKIYERDFQMKRYFFKQCSDKIKNYLDVITFIIKFEEVNHLKKIIFNKYQLNIIGLLNKPFIYYNDLDLGNDENSDEETILKNFLENPGQNDNAFDQNILNMI